MRPFVGSGVSSFDTWIRAKLGLVCAKAATMRSQVVGQSLRGSTRTPYHGFSLYRPRFLPPVTLSFFLFHAGFAFCSVFFVRLWC